MNLAAGKAQRAIRQQRAWKEPGLRQDLKPITNTEDGRSFGGAVAHLAHDRRGRSDCPAAQVVAVRKPAWQHDQITRRQVGLAVPHAQRLPAADAGRRRADVEITFGTRKDNAGGSHEPLSSRRTIAAPSANALSFAKAVS